jgi:hypothetical protein
MRKEVKTMIDFASTMLSFEAEGPDQSDPTHITFPTTVRKANAAVKGFDIHYADGDHHILREGISVHSSIAADDPRTVNLVLDFILNDNSHDKPYFGSMAVLVIVERD